MYSWSLRETATSRLRFRRNSSLYGFIGGYSDRYRLLRSESLYSCLQTPYRSNPCRIFARLSKQTIWYKENTILLDLTTLRRLYFYSPRIEQLWGRIGPGPEVCGRSVLMCVGISEVWLRTKNHFSSLCRVDHSLHCK
jgi:hypothetical protein